MSGWTGVVKNDLDVTRVIEYLRIALQGCSQAVNIKPFKLKRSLAQNALMWLWYDEICKHVFDSYGTLYSSNDMHEYFKQKFLPTRTIDFKNKVIQVQVGTSELNVMEMMDYLDKLDFYCAEKLNLILTKPEDLWTAATAA